MSGDPKIDAILLSANEQSDVVVAPEWFACNHDVLEPLARILRDDELSVDLLLHIVQPLALSNSSTELCYDGGQLITAESLLAQIIEAIVRIVDVD